MIRTEKSTQEQITTSSPAQTDNAACSDNHPAVYDAGQADVAVVGAGHAGIEAALACARGFENTFIYHEFRCGGQHAL